MRRLLFVLTTLCLMVTVVPAWAQTFSETFVSEDGRISISYPKGWFITEEFGSITLSTLEGQTANWETRLEPGAAFIAFTVLNDETGIPLNMFEGETPTEKLESLITLMQAESPDPDTALSFSAPSPIMIGDYSAARTATTYKGSQNQFVLFLMELEDGTLAIAIGATAPQELIRTEPKFIDIAATLYYNPVPMIEAGNPINLDRLVPLTPLNAASLIPLSTLRGNQGQVYALAVSPDGSQVVSGGIEDGLLYVWNVRTGERTMVLDGHHGGIQWVVISPDGKYIASLGRFDGTLRVWDAVTGEQAYITEKGGGLWYAAFSPDSESIAYISFLRGRNGGLNSSNVWLWDFQTGEETMIEDLPTNKFANSINFNAEGTQIIFCAWDDAQHEEAGIWVYDIGDDEITLEKTLQGDPIDAYFTASDQPIVSLNGSSGVQLWDAEQERNIGELQDELPFQTLINPTRAIVGTTGTDENLRLYHAIDGTLLGTLPHEEVVFGLAYSFDGRIVATADAIGTIYLWGIPTE